MLGPTSLHIPLKIAGDSKVSKGVLYVRYIVAWTSGDKKKISPEMGDQPMCDGDLVEGEGLGTCGSINASFLYFGWSRIRFSSFSSKFFFSGEQSFAKFPSKTNHQDQPFPEKIRGVRMTNTTLGAPS